MATDYLFAVGSIGQSTRGGRKPSTLRVAARHNRREIQAEMGAGGRIDAVRSLANETIAGPATAAAVVELAHQSMAAAGIDRTKLRKDHAQAIELLFSLPAQATIDSGQYFRDCLSWAGKRFGDDKILSADIHRDESTPHCHVLLLPLVDGKMKGSELLGREATAEHSANFFVEVASRYGLKRQPKAMTGERRGVAVRDVMAALEATHDPILRSALWPETKRAIERNPAPYLAALGIPQRDPAPKPLRTMAQIFTSPGKGPKAERAPATNHAPQKPIGFEKAPPKPIGFKNGDGKNRNLSCVGFAIPAPALNRPTEPRDDDDKPGGEHQGSEITARSDGNSVEPFERAALRKSEGAQGKETNDAMDAGDYTRERDDEHGAGEWDETLGEFVTAPRDHHRVGSISSA